MHIPVDRLLRRNEVEELVGLARSSVYAKIANNQFPSPVRIGERGVRWRESEIRAWIASRQTARPDTAA